MKPTTKRALLLLRAADGGWVSGNRLGEVAGWRFGGRLYELRQMGYTIERRSAPNGNSTDEYRLIEPEPQQLTLLEAVG